MEFSVKSGTPEKQRTGCVVVGVFEKRRLSPPAVQIDTVSHGFLGNLIRRGDMEGKLGQTLVLHNVPETLADRVLLVGCGPEREFNDTHYATAVGKSLGALRETGASEAVNFLTDLNVKGRDLYWKVREAVLKARDTAYLYKETKSGSDKTARSLRRIILSVPRRADLPKGEKALRDGGAIADGVELARELGNLPGNISTPGYLAEQGRRLARRQKALTVKVLERKDMETLGMGALLSVARGSHEAPKFVIMEYRGGTPEDKPVVLVGKGVTFDSGGISLKPADKMDEMKFDMCGAASVLGVMKTLTGLRLPLNVIGLVPSTENLPGGSANKPGDVVTSMSGQTIEVLNTDAEGRLILCDALTYAERYEPAAVIDIATLTGACVVALGAHASGLLGNHQALANDLLAAGRYTGDRAWELPLWDEYQEQLDTNFADMANIGGREAGTITAACFLSRFARKYHWCHLDIAGTAWKSGKAKGATGRPVPLLAQYLLDKAGH